MDFNSLRKEISSNNSSVKELINDIFAKIDLRASTQPKSDMTRATEHFKSESMYSLLNQCRWYTMCEVEDTKQDECTYVPTYRGRQNRGHNRRVNIMA